MKRLLGDFAFRLYGTTAERKLFCAERPLRMQSVRHSTRREIDSSFASDVKGRAGRRWRRPQLNEPLLAAYLQMRNVFRGETSDILRRMSSSFSQSHTLTLTSLRPEASRSSVRFGRPEDAPRASPAGRLRIVPNT